MNLSMSKLTRPPRCQETSRSFGTRNQGHLCEILHPPPKQDTPEARFLGTVRTGNLVSLLFTARLSNIEKGVLEGSGIRRLYFVFELKPSTLI